LKILHISTYDIGGAGSAALNLHKGLLANGVESKFLCLNKHTTSINHVYQFNNTIRPSTLERLYGKLKIKLNWHNLTQSSEGGIEGDYEIFTFPTTKNRVHLSPLVEEADIINLHWIAGFIDYETFFRAIKKPIVWTLHDKNPTLGGFHLLNDKLKNPHLSTLEKVISLSKSNYISLNKDINVVSPSKFLLNFSKNSVSLNKYNHYHIQNSVDTGVFKPFNKEGARELFNLPNDKIIVLFLDSKSPHKGTSYIKGSLDTSVFDNIQFVALGQSLTAEIPDIINIEYIHDPRLLRVLYSAADYFILPSIEDNLPNMMLESMACGTPVVGFPTGGIVDVIESGVNGLLSKEATIKNLNCILEAINNGKTVQTRDKISKFADEGFSLDVQANRYIKLYKGLIN
jgi:glycosyltransferase involved in cell wall biosynthesis